MKSDGKATRHASRPLVVNVRVEWNLARNKVVWNVSDNSGCTASGFADSHVDAMRDAAAFVEAMAQPRAGDLFAKTELRIVK